jgi:restriction system protein
MPHVDVKPMLHEFAHIAIAFWPLWAIILGGLAVKFALEVREMRRLSRSGIADIDQMDGRTFEIYLSGLFHRLGYAVEVTRFRGDYGADLIVKKDGRKIAVQAKRYAKAVGLKAVQEVLAARGMYGCDSALVVANQEFTPQAVKLARANGVTLWGREALIKQLLATQDAGGGSAAAEPA